jgi:hypothetical protein
MYDDGVAGEQFERPPSPTSSSSSSSFGSGEEGEEPSYLLPLLENESESDEDRRDAEMEDAEGGGERARAEPSTSSRHAYLGDIDQVSGAGSGTGACLAPGTKVKLSIYPLQRTVVFPGESVPLIMNTERASRLIARIMAAPKPFTRLFGMIHFSHRNTKVGSTVELIQMKHNENETSLLVKAHQRFTCDFVFGGGPGQVHIDDLGLLMSEVEILPDVLPSQIPKPVREDSSFWCGWAHKPFNVFYLSSRAKDLYESLVPHHEIVQDAHFGSMPVQFSFYIASVLPLSSERQQLLLECPTASERLLGEIRIMSKMIGNRLSCQTCNTSVALAKDVFRMSSEGISGVFVNTHGFIHDIVTLLTIRTELVQLQGTPETEHCWFPGYAWTIANCKTCGCHLGWRFTRVSEECSPESFWGFSRDALSIPS